MQNSHNNKDYPFKPRGIIKWNAFAAVISADAQFEAIIEDDIIDINLLDDYKYYINYILQEAILMNKEVSIKYIYDNRIYNTNGYIIEYNDKEKKILINDLQIELISIKEIVLL